ncbi:MAG: MurR/RpiR family transcriptional regulator [Ruminococcaceae bacterium]|nr:MurR/RpiR family transcriptional regulator [Oscillospiraceae bacterium]
MGAREAGRQRGNAGPEGEAAVNQPNPREEQQEADRTPQKPARPPSGRDSQGADLIALIEEAMPRLSKGQKQIARFIVSHYEQAAYMTASALGAEVGVSESTVVRFSGELGFSGYPELQAQIRETVRVSLTSVQRIHAANHRMEEKEVLDRILTQDAENVRATLEHIDRDAFERAVEMILGAKNIYILGMRSSAVLAQFMSYYFELLFDNVRLIHPAGGSEIFEHLMKVRRDDVFVAISFPRYTTGIVNATGYASSRGAGVVAITDSLSSPIAAHADVTLVAGSDMASFVDSLVAPLSLINAIVAYIGRKKQAEVTETLDRLEQVWKEYHVYTK